VSVEVKDVLSIALPSVLPTLMVLVGILTNKNDINHVRTEISGLRTEMNATRSDISILRKQLHDDIVMLVGRDTDKAERLARLEERTKG
jgi:hypothetical protein